MRHTLARAEISFSCRGALYFLRQEKEQELEQLTKELRQVNLQQFIQQTGTKVTVLPAQPAAENYGMYTHIHKYTHVHMHSSTNKQYNFIISLLF